VEKLTRLLAFCKRTWTLQKKALDTAARPNNLKMSFGFQSIFLLNGGLRLSDPGTLTGIAAIIAALAALLAEVRKLLEVVLSALSKWRR
jgi:hypothetical protein